MHKEIPQTPEECLSVLGITQRIDVLELPAPDRETYIKDMVWGHPQSGPPILSLIHKHQIESFVEIGSQTGFLTELITKVFPEVEIYCVDLEFHRPQLPEQYPRIKQIQGDSTESAKLFENNSIDMVYIDADHSYAGVKRDLETWWPKTKKIFSGHDYQHPLFSGCTYAIDEFLQSKNHDLNKEPYYNWWTEKE